MTAPLNDALTAVRRYGFGARTGELARIASDPRGYVQQQFKIDLAQINDPKLKSSEAAIETFVDMRRDGRRKREDLKPVLANMSPEEREKAGAPKASDKFPKPRAVLTDELNVRLQRAIAGDAPLLERLALHWCNHFTVSAFSYVAYFSGPMEREAIRPHMLGNFGDMLRAATLHPAMLYYLDNRNSIGPQSKMGGGGKRGLNENLGRELLELHTLGVDGGYTQDDVIEVAKALTGWTIDVSESPNHSGPRLIFDARKHEPGERTILGKRYADSGERQIPEVLRDLARHPSTARHVTRRLARHFVGVEPPAELQQQLAAVFLSSEGDLGAVTAALIASPLAWVETPRKIRPPIEFMFAAGRLFGRPPAPPDPLQALQAMGQPYCQPATPAGWAEEDNAWAAPDALKTRLDWSVRLSKQFGNEFDARELATVAFGDAVSNETTQALRRAESREQALTLLLLSPEFQRR